MAGKAFRARGQDEVGWGSLTLGPLAQPWPGPCFGSLAHIYPKRSLDLFCGRWSATQVSEIAKFWS